MDNGAANNEDGGRGLLMFVHYIETSRCGAGLSGLRSRDFCGGGGQSCPAPGRPKGLRYSVRLPELSYEARWNESPE